MSRAALLHSGFRVMKTTHGETQTIPGGINAHKIGQTLLVIISTFTGTREIAILLIFLKSYLTNIHSKDIMTLRRYSHNGIKWTEFPHDTLDAKSGVSILSMGRPRTSTAGSTGVREAPRACSSLCEWRLLPPPTPVSLPDSRPQSRRSSQFPHGFRSVIHAKYFLDTSLPFPTESHSSFPGIV